MQTTRRRSPPTPCTPAVTAGQVPSVYTNRVQHTVAHYGAEHSKRNMTGRTKRKRVTAKQKRAARRAEEEMEKRKPNTGKRGKDFTPLVRNSIALIFFHFCVLNILDDGFFATDDQGNLTKMPRLKLGIAEAYGDAALKGSFVVLQRIIQEIPSLSEMANTCENYVIMQRQAKKWREERFIAGRVMPASLQPTSRRDGRVAWNKKNRALAEQYMKKANDQLLGGGTWADLARDYNNICTVNNHPEMMAGATSMWNWAGEFKWTIHRRWIKVS